MADAQTVKAIVEVKSAWLSKINWTQAVSGGAMIAAYLTGGKLDMTPDQQAALVVTIGVVGNFATFVIKTWFTPTITPASVTTQASVTPESITPAVKKAG